MAITVKEINDDAQISIKVNKNFYLMTKSLSFYLFKQIGQMEAPDEYIKTILTKKYGELDELQRSFYTVALLLAEMENNFKAEKLFTEKKVLEPGDEGYVAPTEG